MKLIALSLLFAMALVSVANGAKTIYVDCKLDDYTGHDGTSWEKAYKTIQQGIDKAASGDTVLVESGVYDEGTGKAVASWGKSRIGWNNKVVNIISVHGAEQTHIVGEKSTDENAEHGVGPGAMRILAIYDNSGSSCAGSVIKGFTMRGGATVSDKTSVENGQDWAVKGGACVFSNSKIVISDCIIKDSSAKQYSVAYNGTFIRCRFENNYTIGDILVGGVSPKLYACVATRNVFSANAKQSSITGGTLFENSISVYNSTFVDNVYATFSTEKGKYVNSIIYNSGSLRPSSDSLIYSGCVSNNSDPYPVLATTKLDIRVRGGSKAETAGDASLLASLSLEDGVVEKIGGLHDYHGNELPESGVIAAGATQTVVTPAAGGLHIALDAYATIVDGNRKLRGDGFGYVFPETFPTQYVLTAYNTNPDYRLSHFYFGNTVRAGNYGQAYDYRFPTRDDKLYFMPPANPQLIITNVATRIQPKVYLSPDAVADEADGSYDKPYRTFASAIKKHGGSVVYIAKRGTYTEDGAYKETSAGRTRLQLENVMRITSEEGAEHTFIVGAKDTSEEATASGCGPNAVRALYTNANMQQIQGFTITGCYSGKTGEAAKGGAVYANAYMHIADCILSNNYAVTAGAMYNGWAERCIITDNHADDYVLSVTRSISSIIYGNHLSSAWSSIVGDGTVIHSMVIGERAANKNPFNSGTRRHVSAFMNGGTIHASSASTGNIYDNFISVPASFGGILAKLHLADPEGGDFRPLAFSSVFTGAVVPGGENYGTEYSFYAMADFYGNRIKFNADGKPVAGPFMEPSERHIVVLNADNGGVSPAGTRAEHEAGATITYTSAAGNRPCVGLAVNGEKHYFDDGDIAVSAPAGGLLVEALYTKDWYAAVDGNDNNSGFTPKKPKTLKGMLACADVVAGDTVWALPGTYETGEMFQSEGIEIPARAVVPARVTLASLSGPAVTTIKGEKSDVYDTPANSNFTEASREGIGKNAVRCVYLNTGSVVSGFTITNGFTRSADDAGVVSHGGADYTGGGVHCSDREGIISNCVVSGCGSYRGGGVFRGKTYNSVLFGNRVLYGGGGVSDSSVYGTLTYSNKCASTVNYSGIFFPYHVEDCTVLDGCGNFYFNDIKAINNVYAGVVYKESKTFATNTFNCVYNSKYANQSSFEGFEGIVVADSENLKFDENFRPVIGANAAIDCYSAAHATVPYAKTDVLGGQRVYNGARDIGAVEADWRMTYARDLAPKSLSVVEAGENVVESIGKTVVVPAGERMAIDWAGRGEMSVDYAFRAKVDAGVELKVYLNDELFATVQGDGGEQELAFGSDVPVNGLVFECTGQTGSAELYAFARQLPTMTIYVK